MSSESKRQIPAYDELRGLLREVATLAGVSNLLAWDQETMMPSKGGGFRADQISLVTRLSHERACNPRIGELLDTCETAPELTEDPLVAANLREIRRDYERVRRLPVDLVAEISETNSRALEAWKRARQGSDFAEFRPWLERQIELGRRKAACYGTPPGGEPYDCLLQDFERDINAAELDRVFRPLRAELLGLIGEIGAAPRRPSTPSGPVRLPLDKQKEFTDFVLAQLGFDLGAGRVDVSTHPFSTSIGPGDTRLTTRYWGERFLDALGSTMHEAGHAMYEQGIPKHAHFGEPLGDCASLGIHESQSRMWENEVGHSRAFWEWAFPEARKHFGSVLDDMSIESFYEAINLVRPNPIRTDSDELTYNLHIMIRFDLERAMIAGDLAVDDLPAVWNERMRLDLGVEVPDDSRGCLQDIHWAMGAIGYFPSYSLGNLYAAQFWQTARRELPDLESHIAAGKFSYLLSWLRDKIHRQGRRFTAPELCKEVTGSELGHRPLIDSLRAKLLPIYGVGCST